MRHQAPSTSVTTDRYLGVLFDAWHSARDRIAAANERAKYYADRFRREEILYRGQKVWLSTKFLKPSGYKQHKLQDK